MSDTPEFAYQVMELCAAKLRKAGHLVVDPRTIVVRYDLRGRSRLGQANFTKMLVRLNAEAARAIGPGYEATIAHEYAHIVAFALEEAYGSYGMGPDRPHGLRWQKVMRLMGYEPERTATAAERAAIADVQPARRSRKFVYAGVNCGHEHLFTNVRHSKASSGRMRYVCRRDGCKFKPASVCGLAFTGKERVA